jgi:hypothetical protein
MVTEFVRLRDVAFEGRDASEPEHREWLMAHRYLSVPVVIVGERHIVGYRPDEPAAAIGIGAAVTHIETTAGQVPTLVPRVPEAPLFVVNFKRRHRVGDRRRPVGGARRV